MVDDLGQRRQGQLAGQDRRFIGGRLRRALRRGLRRWRLSFRRLLRGQRRGAAQCDQANEA
jgi:hypothetical protein